MQVADVEWHCPEQGVPVKVSDPRTLPVVADVLLADAASGTRVRGSSPGPLFGNDP